MGDASMTAEERREFLAALEEFGGSTSNRRMREKLGWDEDRYTTVKKTLIDGGIIVPRGGPGGSVKLAETDNHDRMTEASAAREQEGFDQSDNSRRRIARPLSSDIEVTDYRHEDTRRNIPPAKIAAEGRVPEVSKVTYSYSPRLDPVLRFDGMSEADRIPELIEEARQRRLNEEEVRILAEALRVQEPWLEWAGKQEAKTFEIDPIALHIHERVSAQAIIKVAARQDVTRDLFADPQQEYHKAVQFYQHDIDWTNRLILGDSLLAMTSLAEREDLAGKVQMVYFDPPYGIRFGSNFQVDIGDRDSKDQERYLTREPEMIRAYRDTWSLGVHSYLAYLRDRLIVARNLLKDVGSIFVQIGDENLPSVSLLMDEVFGRRNRIQIITFKKKSSTQKGQSIVDYLLWYAKDRSIVKMPDIYTDPGLPEDADKYTRIELQNGERRIVSLFSDEERKKYKQGLLRDDYPVVSQGSSETRTKKILVEGKELFCGSNRHWRYDDAGMQRLEKSGRLRAAKSLAFGVAYWGDVRLAAFPNVWTDMHGEFNPQYVVQTNRKVIERCMLMSTEPGDLVLDPTCGSGTTAYIAEKLGRKWITMDTSRIAIAIARQRILTSEFEYYELKDENSGVDGGFQCETVSQITLGNIANNRHLDPIFAKHDPILDENLDACNNALNHVTNEIRRQLQDQFLAKRRAEGVRSITDAENRRWNLPGKSESFQHWTMPFDTDPAWPSALSESVQDYRIAWRAKMDEVNECIKNNAAQTELIDRPIRKRNVVRVSGPFTVEAIQPPETSLGDLPDTPIGGVPEEIEDTFAEDASEINEDGEIEARNVEAYFDQILRLLRQDGVRFPDNKQMKFSRLEAMVGDIHAEGRWVSVDEEDEDQEGRSSVAVVVGPQYGPVTAKFVEEVIRLASRRGYDDLVVAGFNFDGAAQTVIGEAEHPTLRVHMAHICPDVNPGMNGLLKEQPGAQLFTVFGQPRTVLEGPDDNGDWCVRMEGVDIYDPVRNVVEANRADKVAAWFLDTDYDGRTFCITQAFFPKREAWSKLARELNGVVDAEAFEKLSGTESLPFPTGKHRTVAVKVIDPRGNEVMSIHRLEK